MSHSDVFLRCHYKQYNVSITADRTLFGKIQKKLPSVLRGVFTINFGGGFYTSLNSPSTVPLSPGPP